MIDLLSLVVRTGASTYRETEAAYFLTQIPWQAPEAYLHIIYRPLPGDVIARSISGVPVPTPVVRQLNVFNGARLFAGALLVFGVRRSGDLLSRDGVLSLPPLDIVGENVGVDQTGGFAIGIYPEDGALVQIDQHTGVVRCRREGDKAYEWASLDEWLTSECERLGAMFDSVGHLYAGQPFPGSPCTRRPPRSAS